MKKIRLPVIVSVVAMLLLFTTACKKVTLEIEWYSLEGSGTYNSLDNTSTIKLSGSVELILPNVATELIEGRIEEWEFIISEGPSIVLYIHSAISYDVLGDYTLKQSKPNSSFLQLGIETVIPRAGDIYNGANPDTVTLTLAIIDTNDNLYSMSAAAPFKLTRE
jgi:hypothetical protein